jgi:hypothetical protein
MLLACKLIIYNYFANYYTDDENYHIGKIIREYENNSYVNGESFIELDILCAKKLIKHTLSFDEALKTIDASESAAALSQWYKKGTKEKINGVLDKLLDFMEQLPFSGKKVEGEDSIFALDALLSHHNDELNSKMDELCVILTHFVNHCMTRKLLKLSYVFNPANQTHGWWYDKFCVTTYVFKIVKCAKAVPQTIRNRVLKVAKDFIKSDDDMPLQPVQKHPEALRNIYVRFCGIGKEHFNKHKMVCVNMFMKYLRDKVTDEEKIKFDCYEIIEDYGRLCKDVYVSNREFIDSFYLRCHSDKEKNLLFHLLCVPDEDEIDINCFYYVFDKLINNK